MFETINRRALLHALHQSIEQVATFSTRQLMERIPDLEYPPGSEFLPDEVVALASIPKSDALARAFGKVLTAAAAAPIFDLLCVADGVTDWPKLTDGSIERVESEMLHDEFLESYAEWLWRKQNRIDK